MTKTVTPALADVDAIREAFPALDRIHAGQPAAYFDGPGGTQVPAAVADAVADYLLRHNANTHWEYATSRETDRALEESRVALADFVGGIPQEIAFGANMTTLTFHVARALGHTLEPGSTLVVTELDHHANVAPWRTLAVEKGLRVRSVRLDTRTGRLDPEDWAGALAARPALVAIGAASNILGTVNDVTALAAAARAAGALVCVDAVHFAAHGLVDVQSWGCDLLACSAYKFYGPHVGVLWGRQELLQELDFPRLDPAPQVTPERAETGTQNHEGIVGAAAAVDFLAGLGGSAGGRRERLRRVLDQLESRSAALGDRLREGLQAIAGVRVYGPGEGPRTPTVSFSVGSRAAEEVASRLSDERGLFLSHGDFYAPTVVERFGAPTGGFVRAGCACYTTAAEVDRLLEAVEQLAAT